MFVYADHVVKVAGEFFVEDFEEDAQFIVSFAAAVQDRLHMNLLGAETRKEVLGS